MITEDYVSFETAKLLKEKGFEGKMHTFYTEKGIEMESAYVVPSNFFPIYCPTLQMVMKWLREEHNLYVFPFPQMNTNKFWVEIYQLDNGQEWENLYCESIDLQDYSFYEEACEAGIKYCLKNLI